LEATKHLFRVISAGHADRLVDGPTILRFTGKCFSKPGKILGAPFGKPIHGRSQSSDPANNADHLMSHEGGEI
jgi:hypothetical protein